MTTIHGTYKGIKKELNIYLINGWYINILMYNRDMKKLNPYLTILYIYTVAVMGTIKGE